MSFSIGIYQWPLAYEQYNLLALAAQDEGWKGNGRCEECGYWIFMSPDGLLEFCRCKKTTH